MGKYSSDSEDDRRGKSTKSKSKRRSSSSDSDEGRSRRRRDSKKSSRRSRSRERYSRSKRSRSNSPSNRFSKSYCSGSKDRSSRHRRSSSRDRRRSASKDKHRRSRRSRSRSYIREYISKTKKRSSSSDSSSSSIRSRKDLKKVGSSDDKKLKENLKYKDNSPDCLIIDNKTLHEINDNKFCPKQFSSSRTKKVPENIVIDLKKQTIKVPELEPIEPDSIFHHSLFLSEEARMEKWVKDLYSFRQKALQQGLKNSH